MGNGVIGYHAYNVYEYNTDNDDLMIYDITEEKHYALFVDDPDIAPTKRSDHWAHVSGRNVAWFSQYAWGYVRHIVMKLRWAIGLGQMLI